MCSTAAAKLSSNRFGRLRELLREHLKIAAAAAAALVLAAAVFADGMEKAKAAKEGWERSSAELQREISLASSLPAARSALERARLEWEEARRGYEASVDGGLAFGVLGRLAEESGVKDVSVSDAGGDAKFHKGHLKAKYYRIRIAGPFPAVLRVLQGLEASGIPAEIKPLKVAAAASGTEVAAEGTLVLYSLSPPARVERISGESGKYDPFFDYEIRRVEIERRAAEGATAPGGASLEAAGQGAETGGGDSGAAAPLSTDSTVANSAANDGGAPAKP